MGLWGAAQALAFAVGGVAGTGASDLARQILGAPDSAYAAVFILQAVMFLIAAAQAGRVSMDVQTSSASQPHFNLAPTRIGSSTGE
jgi:BCD family chlorophyll transporter-like MFS transporter